MHGENNPYAPPNSDVNSMSTKELERGGKPSLFSVLQASAGALFGGMPAGTYYIAANYLNLGQRNRAYISVVMGGVFAFIFSVMHSLLADSVYGYLLNLAYPIITWIVVGKLQVKTVKDADFIEYEAYSSFYVLVVAAVSFCVVYLLGMLTYRLLKFPQIQIP